MVMSSKKIGKMVGADVDKALANISAATKPDMKDDTIKTAAAPQKAQTFSEAFKAARADKGAGKTFTWFGKSYSTNKAGEGAKKTSGRSGTAAPAAAATAPKAATTKAPEVNARTKEFFSKTPLVPKKEEVKTPTAKDKPKRDNTAAGRRARFADMLGAPGRFAASLYTGVPSGKTPPMGKRNPILKTGDEAREANRRQGTIGGMKKGGSVDGIAIRGKTRAPMKKGK